MAEIPKATPRERVHNVYHAVVPTVITDISPSLEKIPGAQRKEIHRRIHNASMAAETLGIGLSVHRGLLGILFYAASKAVSVGNLMAVGRETDEPYFKASGSHQWLD